MLDVAIYMDKIDFIFRSKEHQYVKVLFYSQVLGVPIY